MSRKLLAQGVGTGPPKDLQKAMARVVLWWGGTHLPGGLCRGRQPQGAGQHCVAGVRPARRGPGMEQPGPLPVARPAATMQTWSPLPLQFRLATVSGGAGIRLGQSDAGHAGTAGRGQVSLQHCWLAWPGRRGGGGRGPPPCPRPPGPSPHSSGPLFMTSRPSSCHRTSSLAPAGGWQDSPTMAATAALARSMCLPPPPSWKPDRVPPKTPSPAQDTLTRAGV